MICRSRIALTSNRRGTRGFRFGMHQFPGHDSDCVYFLRLSIHGKWAHILPLRYSVLRRRIQQGRGIASHPHEQYRRRAFRSHTSIDLCARQLILFIRVDPSSVQLRPIPMLSDLVWARTRVFRVCARSRKAGHPLPCRRSSHRLCAISCGSRRLGSNWTDIDLAIHANP